MRVRPRGALQLAARWLGPSTSMATRGRAAASRAPSRCCFRLPLPASSHAASAAPVRHRTADPHHHGPGPVALSVPVA